MDDLEKTSKDVMNEEVMARYMENINGMFKRKLSRSLTENIHGVEKIANMLCFSRNRV